MTTTEIQNKLLPLESYLLNFAYSLTDNRDDAKNLLQDTFLRIYKYGDKFEMGSNFKAWSYTIMKNIFINKYNRLKYFRLNILYTITAEISITSCSYRSNDTDPLSIYATKELRLTIKTLDENSRKPLEMHIEGYKYDEISKKLGLKIGTVKSRIFFARKKLMAKLADYQY
ncbi:MAG: RNA polymerase sigma factor [Prolixibacteraceae bacterium]|nr:RNA polymerase sigma factor [Prolixibacteraceae bacterium]